MGDSSGLLGTWYFNAGGRRFTVRISESSGSYAGTFTLEGEASEILDRIAWDEQSRLLELRRNGAGIWEWYRGRVVEGVFAGRSSQSASSSEKPADLTSYRFHVTGWNAEYLDRDIFPRVYEIFIADSGEAARLRIDRVMDGSAIAQGRFKIYSGPSHEQSEYDVEVTRWDGTHLTFVRHTPGVEEVYTGEASDRTISGTLTRGGCAPVRFWGTRAEVLTYGLSARSADDRASWQERTRRALQHLTMAGNPAYLDRVVTTLRTDIRPIEQPYPPHRDDNPDAFPQRYRMTELLFTYALPDPYDSASTITRSSHAYLALPAASPSPGKLRAVLAVNGHSGSALSMMSEGSAHFWYGDSFARRGYAVLALDISHRDDSPLYSDMYSSGDDPTSGNGPHPSIRSPGFDTDWEEDGERVWDAMQALSYLLSLPEVEPGGAIVTGLSLGGEITTQVAAHDTRVMMSIPAGYSPDMGVMLWYGNHPCFRWAYADIREYVDVSDYHALTAPRPLIVQTGMADFTFSSHDPPFAADKQVARRARAAYAGDARRYVHDLHHDEHHYHVGDVNLSAATERGVWVPAVTEPQSPGDIDWQSDRVRTLAWPTLYDAIDGLLK